MEVMSDPELALFQTIVSPVGAVWLLGTFHLINTVGSFYV